MTVCLVYVTAKDATDALRIGQAIVKERLAACANILPKMTSVYEWQGQLETSEEAVLILKTTQDRADAVVAAVGKLHPYDVPCALVLPVQSGNAAFLDWIRAGVSPSGS